MDDLVNTLTLGVVEMDDKSSAMILFDKEKLSLPLELVEFVNVLVILVLFVID